MAPSRGLVEFCTLREVKRNGSYVDSTSVPKHKCLYVPFVSKGSTLCANVEKYIPLVLLR